MDGRRPGGVRDAPEPKREDCQPLVRGKSIWKATCMESVHAWFGEGAEGKGLATAPRPPPTSHWGPWLCCEHPECLWNGARDYAASLNIARLGLALFLTARRRTPSQSNTLTALKVKPALLCNCSDLG